MPGAQLVAVNTSNGSTRAVADIGYQELHMLRMTEDGTAIFYSASEPYLRTRVIFRIATDGESMEMLVDSAQSAFDILPDGSLLAYASYEDSLSFLSPLCVLNTADGTTEEVQQDVADVVGISPDGGAVLHGSSPRSELLLTSVDDGSTTTIWSDDSYEHRLVGHRWEEGDVQLLFLQSDGLYILEVLANATRHVATLPGTPTTVGWSSDGQFLAAWVSGECLRSEWWECELRQYTLHLIDADAGSVTQIGQGNFADSNYERPIDLRFSPDGRQVAYVYDRPGTSGSLLYVMDLP
jgi:Tol biopolymer transport system component